MRIRFTQFKDLGDIAKLDKIIVGEKAMSLGDVVGFIGGRGNRAYTIVEGEINLIGFLFVSFTEENLDITKFIIAPDYRRNKFGTKMIERLTGVLEQHNKKRITALVNEEDVVSQKFWKALRAKPKLLKKHFGDRDGILFTLEEGLEL